jgi:hypothetical protein
MRDHDGFGAAVSAGSEQFERAATGGGRTALAVWHRWGNFLLAVLSYRGLIDRGRME